MKKLIPMNSYGLFADTDETARVDSRFIAQTFNKRHRDVLRDIRNLLDPNNGLSANFSQRNFALTSYVDSQGKRRPCYQLTRDGFVMLIMGYNGAKANRFKELYIHQFNEMEEQIKILRSARIEFPMLTQQIQFIHENPKAYHYSNEEHGLEKGTSIRPYLSSDQLKQIDALQKIDIGLMVGIPNYQERKQKLEWYYAKTYGMKGLDSNATA